jgi:hypothetical protein
MQVSSHARIVTARLTGVWNINYVCTYSFITM